MAHRIILILAIAVFMTSCIGLSRYEEDLYTISLTDTTETGFVQNAPDNDDNGVVFPSSRVFNSERYLLQTDSLVVREYPNFIRMGVFESIGLIGSGASKDGLGTGMFGIFPDLDKLTQDFRGDDNNVFVGGIYRYGIAEWRLRWFRDAKDWTYGFSAYEVIMPDAKIEHRLTAVLPLYIRKRYYLREEIPYIALTPTFGLGYYPSQYVNLAGALEVGSLGGLNLRAYLGLTAGFTSEQTQRDFSGIADRYVKSGSQVFPYFGLGISFLDFHNIVPETEREWKNMEHSSWDIGVLQIGFINTDAETSIFGGKLDEGEQQPFIKGYYLRVLNANLALPILNNQIYAGTSLMNLMILGEGDWGMGILPLRLGYWQVLLQDELSLEPFVELSYYPSNYVNLGAKINLRVNDNFNVAVLAGYVTGDNNNVLNNDLIDQYGISQDFSRPYIGINIGVFDRIFFPDDLRYNR